MSARVRALLLRALVLPVTVLATLAGLVLVTSSSVGAATLTRTQRVHEALTVASNQIGDPYVYGADGPNAFDCSGLVYFSFQKAGFNHIPRTASSQASFARHIKKKHLRKGDFIFFYNSTGIYHVGIFDGWHNGHRKLLHAPRPGQDVKVAKLWTSRWFAATLRPKR
jgi:cell wall-associated NlpC family hydrolase